MSITAPEPRPVASISPAPSDAGGVEPTFAHAQQAAEPQPVRWSVAQYHRLAELGLITGRTELLEGEILLMSPQKPRHACAIEQLLDVLRATGWPGVWFRVQLPLVLAPDGAPEPDLAVVSGSHRDYRQAHPTSALLVIEVSDTTLEFDRTRKARLYAAHGVAEYWIVNLLENRLEVRRDPRPEASAAGADYTTLHILQAGDSITPLALGDRTLTVAELLA